MEFHKRDLESLDRQVQEDLQVVLPLTTILWSAYEEKRRPEFQLHLTPAQNTCLLLLLLAKKHGSKDPAVQKAQLDFVLRLYRLFLIHYGRELKSLDVLPEYWNYRLQDSTLRSAEILNFLDTPREDIAQVFRTNTRPNLCTTAPLLQCKAPGDSDGDHFADFLSLYVGMLSQEEMHKPIDQKDSDAPSALSEWVGAAFTCGGAVLSWGAVVGEVGAVPFSGGTSAAATPWTIAVAGATTIQCGASATRVYDLYYNHGIREWMKSNTIYQIGMIGLDLITLKGAVGSFKEFSEIRTMLSEVKVGSILSRATRRNLFRYLKSEKILAEVEGVSLRVFKKAMRDPSLLAKRTGWFLKARILSAGNITKAKMLQTLIAHYADLAAASLSMASSVKEGVIHEAYEKVTKSPKEKNETTEPTKNHAP